MRISHLLAVIFGAAALALTGGLAAAKPLTPPEVSLNVSGQSPGRVFEGIGGESAGASTRLLIDYPKKQRDQILDYLFKPYFGASLQALKCELGGDMNSTDGTEPAYFRSRSEYEHPKARYFNRGYETWLMKEARKRNANIRLGLLQWGAPGWIDDHAAPHSTFFQRYYSQDNANYIARVVQCLKRFDGIKINFVGCYNEHDLNLKWVLLLRKALDAAGLTGVHIELADAWNWNLAVRIKANPALFHAVSAVGQHYPHYVSSPAAQATKIPLWSGEDWSGAKPFTATMAKLLNRNYIQGRMVRTIYWALETSYYDNLPAEENGPLVANQPWSGHYKVLGPIWAIAHTTQFAQIGWRYINTACQLLPQGGSVVALQSPHGRNYSVIIETQDATEPQNLTLHIAGGLPANHTLHVWRSVPGDMFAQQPDVTPQHGSVTITLLPHAIYSLTTTTGQHKGYVKAIPPAAPFPLPYKGDFSSVAIGQSPRYFADQNGAFNITEDRKTSARVLEQKITEPQIPWTHQHRPFTVVGDMHWHNYSVACDVRLASGGSAGIIARVGYVPWSFRQSIGYRLMLDASGNWQLTVPVRVIARGRVRSPGSGWHRLKLVCNDGTITASLDGSQIAKVHNTESIEGMAGLATGWNHAWFKRFAIKPLPGLYFKDLAKGAQVSASSDASGRSSDQNAADDNQQTYWSAAKGDVTGAWLALRLSRPQQVQHAYVVAYKGAVGKMKLQYHRAGRWLDLSAGNLTGRNTQWFTFAPVTAQRFRVLIETTPHKQPPALREVELLP